MLHLPVLLAGVGPPLPIQSGEPAPGIGCPCDDPAATALLLRPLAGFTVRRFPVVQKFSPQPLPLRSVAVNHPIGRRHSE